MFTYRLCERQVIRPSFNRTIKVVGGGLALERKLVKKLEHVKREGGSRLLQCDRENSVSKKLVV